MSIVRSELRQAFRRWASRPAVALTAVVTLALGIGTATAIFSVVDGVLLRPLPWRDPDRLVTTWIVRPQWRTSPVFSAAWDRGTISWSEFRDLEQRSRAFERIAVWSPQPVLTLGGASEVVRGMLVSSGFLPALGIEPYSGRSFTPAEDETASDAVIVTYESWQNRFGGGPDVIGRTMTIEGVPRTVVGVLPPQFRFEGDAVELLIPFGAWAPALRSNSTYRSVLRLQPGVTTGQAADDIEPILRGGRTRDVQTSRVELLSESQLARDRQPMLLLLGASMLLMLIACANVAGLLLGETGSRRGEIALRQALGAGSIRIVRQLLVEAGVLGAAGAAFGVVTGWWLTPVLVAFAPATLPRLDTVGVDARALAFAIAIALITTLVVGIWPAIAAARTRPATAHQESRNMTRRRTAASRLVVIGEVGLAVILLVAAALLGETVLRLAAEPVGFQPDGLVAMRMRSMTREVATRAQQQSALVERIRALPGVAAAAWTSAAPFGGNFSSTGVELDGRPGEKPTGRRYIVGDDYFRALGLPIIRGRAFQASDRESVPVAIASREMERRYFGGSAVGRRLRVDGTWFTIVGVAGDNKLLEYDEETVPAFFVFGPQVGFGFNEIVVRAAGDPAAVTPALRRAVGAAGAGLAIVSIETMAIRMRATVANQRYRALLSSAFGGAALLLTAIGIYGLLRREVDERRREIGIRLAVGARPAGVAGSVLSDGARLVMPGLVLGSLAALGTGRLLGAQLYGVQPTDAHVFVVAQMVLVLAALAATAIPAIRASRINPAVTLRGE
jgi:predicted permease